MALNQKIILKKLQIMDAYKTAPADMGLVPLLLRLGNTLLDSLYGSERFDTVVVGDDPLVSLCVAVHLLRKGERVLIAPDSLDQAAWPEPEWGLRMGAIHGHYDNLLAQELSKHLEGFTSEDGLHKALSCLINECCRSRQVSILADDYLQSSHGVVKGARGQLIFFPVQACAGHSPYLNPLWRLAKRKITNLAFNRIEIEFIQAGGMVFTTPVSAFVDPEIGAPVGQARAEKTISLDDGGRADDVRSAFKYRGNY